MRYVHKQMLHFIHNLQMQYQSMSIVVYFSVELDLSSWMMCSVMGMNQTLMIALAIELVSTTVVTRKMQE